MTDLQKKRPKYFIPLSLLLIALFLLAAGTLAWYYAPERAADTEYLQIDTPPVLYILDNEAQDIQVISLEGVKIGDPHQIVFCVSSVYDINTDEPGSAANFELELAHTNNLGADFDIYAAEYMGQTAPADSAGFDTITIGTRFYRYSTTPMVYTDVSAAMNQRAYDAGDNVQARNVATYHLYDNINNLLSLSFLDPGTNPVDQLFNTRKVRFFVLEIRWDNEIPDVSAKETDLIYVMASGLTAD